MLDFYETYAIAQAIEKGTLDKCPVLGEQKSILQAAYESVELKSFGLIKIISDMVRLNNVMGGKLYCG